MDNQKIGPKKYYVIVAEDDQVYSNLYQTRLVDDNTDVDIVDNGEDAISKAHARRPNLMVLDIVMPIKDGMATLKEIRGDENLKGVPALIISNFPKETYYNDARELGVIDCFYKPDLSSDELIQVIKSYVK